MWLVFRIYRVVSLMHKVNSLSSALLPFPQQFVARLWWIWGEASPFRIPVPLCSLPSLAQPSQSLPPLFAEDCQDRNVNHIFWVGTAQARIRHSATQVGIYETIPLGKIF